MDHSELGGNFGKFRFKFIEPSEYEEVIRILEKYLYVSMVPLGFKPEGAEDFNKFFMEMMKSGQNLSYLAVDSETGEIAACRMVDLALKSKKVETPEFKHKFNKDSFQACIDLCKDIDLFEEFGINEYPDMFGLCTVEKYRKQGLATEMYRRGLQFLKKRGYKVVKCSFVSPYTRSAGVKHGYQEKIRLGFLELKNPEGEVLNPNADPEGFIDFGVFDLRDK